MCTSITHTMADVEMVWNGEVIWRMSGAPDKVLAAVNEELYHGPASYIKLRFNDNQLTDAQVLLVCGMFEAVAGMKRLADACWENDNGDLSDGWNEARVRLDRFIRQLGA